MTLAPEATSADAGNPAGPAPTFDSIDPGRGTVLGSYPVATDADVADAVTHRKDAVKAAVREGKQAYREELEAEA